MNWLKQLLSVPCLAIVAADADYAQLEVAGTEGIARCGEFGICIGLRMQVAPSLAGFNEAQLLLAAAGAVDDGMSIDAQGAIIWRRHAFLDQAALASLQGGAEIWSARLASQLTLLRRLASILQAQSAPILPTMPVAAAATAVTIIPMPVVGEGDLSDIRSFV